MSLPFSAACERNKEPILARLKPLLADAGEILEIGSGTGQHAVHFAAAMPWLRWTCTDLAANLPAIRERIATAELDNLHGPLELDVAAAWPPVRSGGIFSANTAHIMPWQAVEALFAGVSGLLPAGGRFVLYGPFHYGDAPVSAGNAAFDRELRSRGSGEGIRHVESVQALALDNGLRAILDAAMPANNRLLAWELTDAER